MGSAPAPVPPSPSPPPPPHWISPHFTSAEITTEASFEQKVAIFADSVRGWQLDVAKRLMNFEPHGGFAVLSIVMSYFEMIAKHRAGFSGEGSSERYFTDGVLWVFPELDQAEIKRLYKAVRNGMYHDGITGPGIVLEDLGQQRIMGVTPKGEIHISPREFVRLLQVHFSRYIAELLLGRDQALRANFLKRFDLR